MRWTRPMVRAISWRAAAVPVAAIAVCLLVATSATSASAPSGAAPSTVTAGQTATQLPVTPRLLRQLRRALVRSGESARTIVGPLVGRRCVPADAEGEECERFAVRHTVYETTRWALAYFVIGDRVEDVVFLRKRRSRRWNAQRGFGAQEPIPCPVLRSWGQPC